MNNKTILITGGGTGGHISPGIALFEEMKSRGLRPLFLAGKADRKFSSFDSLSSDEALFYGAPVFTKNIFKLPLFAVKFLFAFMRARRIIKKNNVSAVIGMGGYVSAPALMAARSLKRTLFLCEQNSIPGKVTRLFENRALRIYGTLESSIEYLKNKAAFLHAGNPIRKDVIRTETKEEARQAFHLGHCKQVILIIGGSQGALNLNKLIFGLKKEYSAELKDVGIIWSTGAYSYDEFREKVQDEMDGGSIYLSAYIDRVGLAYRASDVAISRSGAGVMMELAATGIPSILIPYPYAADNHQDRNADDFVSAGAAIKIPDKEALPEKVAPLLFDLLGNPRNLDKMSRKALAAARPEAAATIVDDMIKFIYST